MEGLGTDSFRVASRLSVFGCIDLTSTAWSYGASSGSSQVLKTKPEKPKPCTVLLKASIVAEFPDVQVRVKVRGLKFLSNSSTSKTRG